MSQYYVGVKRVFAWPEEKGGRPGYAVVYRHGEPDAYRSWSPAAEFEKFYLPMAGSAGDRITQAMVDGFVSSSQVVTVGKTTVVHAALANGFEVVESSSCVDPRNYDAAVGAGLCDKRIGDRVWHLLGFVLQWANSGLAAGK